MNHNTFKKLLAMLVNQSVNLEKYQNDVSATDDDIDEVKRDAAIMQYIEQYQLLMNAAKKHVTKIKQEIYKGNPNGQVLVLPSLPAAAPPFDLVPGCLERALRRNRRFKSAKGYTEAVGKALGLDIETGSLSPDSITPKLEITTANSDYEAEIIVKNRGKSDMWKLLGRLDGSQKIFEIASGTGRKATVKLQPTDAGKPEKVLVQIQLYRRNKPYGQSSDLVQATFNP